MDNERSHNDEAIRSVGMTRVRAVETAAMNRNPMRSSSPLRPLFVPVILPPLAPGDNRIRKVTPTKSIRRRANGSPVTPINPHMPTKTIYLIRHGQSQGQVAARNGLDRNRDSRLLDCGLTPKGIAEAGSLPSAFTEEEFHSIQLVVSSPLRRALQTSLIAFASKDILVHYDIREVGSRAPENSARPMEATLRNAQIASLLNNRDEHLLFDTTTLKPKDWPRDYSPRVIKMERIHNAFQWLYNQRDESVIAVVCHYNVIRSAVVDGDKLRPCNAFPIRCVLYSNGDLVQIENN